MKGAHWVPFAVPSAPPTRPDAGHESNNMDHDLFEFHAVGMTWGQRAWRIGLLLAVILTLALDLLVWRPA